MNETAFGLGCFFSALLMIALPVSLVAFWVYSIIHVSRNQKLHDAGKSVVWTLIVIFLGPLGSVIYFASLKRF